MKPIKLQQKSLKQTGVAIYTNTEGKEVIVPLFSDFPVNEARDILNNVGTYETLNHVFIASPRLGYDVAHSISELLKNQGFLSLRHMNELRTGFASIYNSKFSLLPIGMSYS